MIKNFKIFEGKTFNSITKTINDYNQFIEDVEPFLEQKISTPFQHMSVTEIKATKNELIFFVTTYDPNYEIIETLDINIDKNELKDIYLKIDAKKYNL